MSDPILLCGPGDDEPDYTGINSPTGRCPKHGDYLYFCDGCAEKWRQQNPERAAEIARLASSAHTRSTPDMPSADESEGSA